MALKLPQISEANKLYIKSQYILYTPRAAFEQIDRTYIYNLPQIAVYNQNITYLQSKGLATE